MTGTVVVPSCAAVATRPISRTVPATVDPSGSSTETAWPGRIRSWRLAERSRVTTRVADVAASTGAPGPTAEPTSAWCDWTRMAPGRNTRSEPSSVPSRVRPVAFCQRLTAFVVFASRCR